MSFKTRVRRVADATGLSYQTCFTGLKAVNGKIVELMKLVDWSEEECDLFFAKWEFDPDAVDPETSQVGWSPRSASEEECRSCERPIIHTFDKKGIGVDEPTHCHRCRPSYEDVSYEDVSYGCAFGCGGMVLSEGAVCDDCVAHMDHQVNMDD